MGEYLPGADVEDDVAELPVPPEHRELRQGGTRMLLGRVTEACWRVSAIDDHFAHPLGGLGTDGRAPRGPSSHPGYLEAQRGRRPTPQRVYLKH
jgi:hypothetical protein